MHAHSRLAAAPADSSSQVLAPLSASAVHLIFNALPPRCRLLCRGVCRAWRAALSDAALWEHLEVCVDEVESGNIPSMLLAAAALARGGLHTLSVCGHAHGNALDYTVLLDRVVLPIVRENASSLRTLRLLPYFFGLKAREAQQLLAAAPLLETLHTDLAFEDADGAAELRAVLCGCPPFGVSTLKLRSLECVTTNDAISAAAFAADAELHAGDHGAPEADPRALGAPQLLLHDGTRRAFLPLLARLIRGGLEKLKIRPEERGFLDLFSDSAEVKDFADACRASTTLDVLKLNGANVFTHTDGAHGVALLAALTGHPTLRYLSLEHNAVPAAATARVGTALGTLVAADAPALDFLQVGSCNLGDAGMSAVADALPRNTHLTTLYMAYNELSAGFTAGALTRGVCANASLQSLHLRDGMEAEEETNEQMVSLERIVAVRHQQRRVRDALQVADAATP